MFTICVDIDGVLNDFQEGFIYYIQKLGYKFDYNYEHYYDLSKGIAVQKNEQVNILNKVFTDDNFWLSLSPTSNSCKGLQYLNDRFSIFITTSPFNEHNKNVKLHWLEKHFPFINSKQVVFTEDKWDLKGDIIIDDNPHILEKCLEHNWITIKKNHPYNLTTNTVYNFNNWNEIDSIIEHLMNPFVSKGIV